MIKTTITISRQMGAGGSYIGQQIAKRLGLKYIDREVLHLAAQEFGCDEETIAARSERVSSFWERVLGGLSFGVPEAPNRLLSPLLSILPGQLFAAALARAKGFDPDSPRGLTKVTLAR